MLREEHDGIMLTRKTFVATCGKERGSISIGRGADLFVGLAHFPLLLPKQVPVLLQRLLLFHNHHRAATTSKPPPELIQTRNPKPWVLPPT